MLPMFSILLIVLSLVSFSSAIVQPAAANDLPVLMLNTGGHQALIGGIAFTKDGKYVVSASEDKAVKVWDYQRGTAVRTLRGQMAPVLKAKFMQWRYRRITGGLQWAGTWDPLEA